MWMYDCSHLFPRLFIVSNRLYINIRINCLVIASFRLSSSSSRNDIIQDLYNNSWTLVESLSYSLYTFFVANKYFCIPFVLPGGKFYNPFIFVIMGKLSIYNAIEWFIVRIEIKLFLSVHISFLDCTVFPLFLPDKVFHHDK